MCLMIQTKARIVSLEPDKKLLAGIKNFWFMSKSYRGETSVRILPQYNVDYEYRFDGDWVMPADEEQDIWLTFELDGKKFGYYLKQNLGYHISGGEYKTETIRKRLTETSQKIRSLMKNETDSVTAPAGACLTTVLIALPVGFRVEDIQLAGGIDVVVKSFRLLTPDLFSVFWKEVASQYGGGLSKSYIPKIRAATRNYAWLYDKIERKNREHNLPE